jgi:DNA-binding MarR family transcriptional regulator
MMILKAVEEIVQNEKRVTVKVIVKVTVNQKKILEAAKKNLHVTLDELSKKIGISRKSITANVKKLKEVGMLNR